MNFNLFKNILLTFLASSIMMFIFIWIVKGDEKSIEKGKGVDRITAGTGVTITPTIGRGNVTITASGGTAGLPLPQGASNYLQYYSTGTNYGLRNSTVTFSSGTIILLTVGADGIKFNDGTTQTSAASNPSYPISVTTFTATISFGGDVFQATIPFVAIPQALWTIGRSTIDILSVECFTHVISTEGSTAFNIVRSTETGGTRVAHQTIHSSSFTVNSAAEYSSRVVPDTVTTGFPRETFALWVTSAPAAGGGNRLPSSCGCNIEFNLRRNQ